MPSTMTSLFRSVESSPLGDTAFEPKLPSKPTCSSLARSTLASVGSRASAMSVTTLCSAKMCSRGRVSKLEREIKRQRMWFGFENSVAPLRREKRTLLLSACYRVECR